jgi:hypothetical protein
VDLESFTIAVLCWVEEGLAALQRDPAWCRIRQRGPAPTLADSEVLTMEVVGAFLGLAQDAAIVRYFRHEHPDWFPALGRVHRTTFTRQAANLWVVKEQVWQRLLGAIVTDPLVSCVDSIPVPVCRFGRAYTCSRFRGEAAFGRDTGSKATFYGLRTHLRISLPGAISAISLAPANVHDRDLVPELVEGARGWTLSDRNYWDPQLTEELAAEGMALLAPFKKRATDPDPDRSHFITTKRWRIETVASQLVERFHLKRVWARDAWHLTSRILRIVLSHTIAVGLCQHLRLPPLSFHRLLD